MKTKAEKINCNRGFTLIELLVVVLIIGILAAVALPQYNKAVLKSKTKSMFSLVRSLANAEEVYYMEHGEYASLFSELPIDLPQKTGTCQFSGMTNYPECYVLGDWEIAIAKTASTTPYGIESYFAKGNLKIISYLENARDLSVMGNITCIAQPAPGQSSGRSELGKSLCRSLGGSAINDTDYMFKL